MTWITDRTTAAQARVRTAAGYGPTREEWAVIRATMILRGETAAMVRGEAA